MPDGADPGAGTGAATRKGTGAGAGAAAPLAPPRRRPRLVSPLLRRILLLNVLPPALLAAAVLYLDQYQNGLLAAEVEALRTQARIYAGGIAEAAVRLEGERAVLVPDLARPLLRRLTEPSPNTRAKLLDSTGLVVADSRVREGQGGAIVTEPLPPPDAREGLASTVGGLYDRLQSSLPIPGARPRLVVESGPGAGSFDWQPGFADPTGAGPGPGARPTQDREPGSPDPAGAADRREELRLALEGGSTPYVRRGPDGRLLVSVAEPARRANQGVGIVLLTREAREVDRWLGQIRVSVAGLFLLALILTVALSLYLARTIATPILQLALAAARMREGQGRGGSVPPALLARDDEIGRLARDLQAAARALWARIDSNERFAADVAHELRNPLTSVRSALETLLRVEDPERRRRLLAIIAEDAVRMDRLIGDIADISRVDGELSRTPGVVVDLGPMLATLAELHEATRAREADPRVVLDAPAAGLAVRGVEDRLVQVFRNLLGNALSFSPPGGCVTVRARTTGSVVEVAVEDEGPGIPEGRLEGIFDRFYSERPQGERFGQHSGLGLSISRQIVEGLGGRIVAENRRDAAGAAGGARFVLRLPAPAA